MMFQSQNEIMTVTVLIRLTTHFYEEVSMRLKFSQKTATARVVCGLWSVGARFGGFHAEGSAEFRRGARYVSTADRQTDRQKHLLYIV
jgi:hypothetical protein